MTKQWIRIWLFVCLALLPAVTQAQGASAANEPISAALKLWYGASKNNILASALAQDKLPKLLPREREIELALSAAPEHLRAEATVYVWQRGGYVKARAGTNGFSCLVHKEDGGGIGPICYDAEGSQTTLLADFRRAQLIEAGKDPAEVARLINEEYKAGKLLAPRKPGVAYMLSHDFRQHNPKTGALEQVFPPHVMFYAPYMKNADIGALPQHRGSQTQPWILGEGQPNAYIIVVTKEPPPPTAHEHDGKMIEGTWVIVEAELSGQKLPEEGLKGSKLILRQGSYRFGDDQGEYKLSPAEKFKAMDIAGRAGPNAGKSFLAIYELKGETLKICYDLAGKARPQEFKTAAGTQQFLVTYRREKD